MRRSRLIAPMPKCFISLSHGVGGNNFCGSKFCENALWSCAVVQFLLGWGGIWEQLSPILAETSPDKAIRHTDLFPPHILWRNKSQYAFNSEVLGGPLIEKCRQLSKAGDEDSDYKNLEENDVPLYSQDQTKWTKRAQVRGYTNSFLQHWFCDGASLHYHIPSHFPLSQQICLERKYLIPQHCRIFYCWLLDGTHTNTEAILLEEKATPSSVAIDRKWSH